MDRNIKRMLMKRLRLIQAQPATDYFAWQTEVNLHNLIDLGYNGNYIDVIGAYTDKPSDSWLKLQQKFPFVRFFFYKDDMKVKNYAPAVQANVLKKHFKAHPYLSEEAIFFHDCDFIFTKFFDFGPYLNDDKWYFSDTISYVGGKYIESKSTKTVNGKGLLDGMCSVVGLCACKVRSSQDSSGGAQKLMKNVTAEYWEEVEEDSINLYNWLLQEKDKYSETGKNDIQIWTASMWSELWNAWKHGHEVIVPKEFDFAWATCPVEKWDLLSFYHNAGVTNNDKGLFYKAKYMNETPYGTDLDIDKDRCSSRYYEVIKEVAKKSVLIS